MYLKKQKSKRSFEQTKLFRCNSRSELCIVTSHNGLDDVVFYFAVINRPTIIGVHSLLHNSMLPNLCAAGHLFVCRGMRQRCAAAGCRKLTVFNEKFQ